jgi:hypothetical protein
VISVHQSYISKRGLNELGVNRRRHPIILMGFIKVVRNLLAIVGLYYILKLVGCH